MKQHQLILTLCIIIALSYILSFSAFIDTDSHDDQRLLQILLILISTLIILISKISVEVFQPSKLNIFITAFFLLGIISSIHAFSIKFAFYEEASLFFLYILSIYIANEIVKGGAKLIDFVLIANAAGCILYTFKFFVIYVSALALRSQPDLMNLIPGFSNYRFLNHTQTITLPLLILYFLLERKNNKANLMRMMFVGFWWSLLFVTGGRGTIAGLLAGSLMVYVVRPKYAASFCRGMLSTSMIGLVVYFVLFVFVPFLDGLHPFGAFFELAHRSIEDPTSGRLQLWHRALELISANPWFGVGPLHFAHYSVDINSGAHPHNIFLQIAAEWGLPALLCLCIAFFIGMRNLLRTADYISDSDMRNQTIFSTWVVIGVAILVDSQVSGLVVMPLSQLFIVLYLGCAVGWAHSFSGNKFPLHETTSLKIRSLQSVLILMSVVGILCGVLPNLEVLFGFGAGQTDMSLPPHGMLHPRIWVEGYF
ncbi:O-antigen ligase family protein [Collimonas antrihumi]|uniref:O-antigen ligase family protein n=1 Tax=Collimonas antrihumi TaxID=1940615 RepID=UPI001B8C3BBD|nr:O-antigen ligase family protein [Collimonas antrihumi]